MKRDWDVIRNLLVEIEEQTYSDNYDLHLDNDAEPRQLDILQIEMADLLLSKGFLTGDRAAYSDGSLGLYNLKLTWDGHELLDTLRDATVWNRIKEISRDKGVDITFESLKIMLSLALTSLLT